MKEEKDGGSCNNAAKYSTILIRCALALIIRIRVRMKR
ncbi:uncharacterized protein G2W53_043446 [Senna tora]|uniref:Uncharacterized protein n=1 Tax=Senna tora TaxID=362788 RepID=A0A834W0K3_9FABA|nr:uncharacterized protein G2W53_043446 [Senna tora]